jgi:FkbM family methyltransferase
MFYGQSKEDEFINSLFNNNFGTCIEVGAYDGITGSNSYYFEQKGWNCLCIEPNKEAFNKCQKIRKNSINCCISDIDKDDSEFTIFHLNENQSAISGLIPDIRLINSHSHLITNTTKYFVKCRSLNSLLEEIKFPTNIDFISIDTENTELDVLKGLDLNKYNVTLFVIENNFDEPFIQTYLEKFGYIKIKRISVNDFYVKQSTKINISIGDIIDKYSILELKQKYIKNEDKLFEINKEIIELSEYKKLIIDKYVFFYKLLLHINDLIWNDTDIIKKLNINDKSYENLALYSTISSTIFENNQKRFRIKNYFNIFLNSFLKEQKSYNEKKCLIIINEINIIYEKIELINYLCVDYDSVLIITPFKDIISKIFINPNIVFYKNTDEIIYENNCLFIDIYNSNLYENKQFYEFEPIKYISGGLLGDFIHQLSVINEKFHETGKKGILYISNIGDSFRFGIEKAYNDTYEIISKQNYIHDYKIYNNEQIDINLSSWRESPLIFNTNLYMIFSSVYGINWGNKIWIKEINYDNKWENKIIINTTNYRFPKNYNFFKNITNLENYIFVSFDVNDFNYFYNVTKMNIEYYTPKSLDEFFIIIQSCKEFIGGFSAPLTFALSMHKKCTILNSSNLSEINHNNLKDFFPNIIEIL